MKNNKRLTTEEFIIKSKAIYGDQYDYSKVSYINNKTCVTLICKKHGEFSIRPDIHLFGKRKRGCQECGKERDKQYSEYLIAKHKHCFVEKARKIHSDKYDYSKSDYIGSKEKIIIICKTCGKEFKQTPNKHLLGRGCPCCASKNNAEKLAKINSSNTEEFIEKAIKIHGNKYGYSKVNYEKANKKICIICPEHGEFWQRPNNHLKGTGCPLCNGPEAERLKSSEEFVKKARKTHRNKYDYSKAKYVDSITKICIICPEHGEFWQTPHSHLDGHGCSTCSESHGEREIRNWLEDHNVKYEREKEFPGLVGIFGKPLRFDFYLPEHNMCIEFDGIQHREWIKGMQTKMEHKNIIEHDRRKNEFCSKNGIRLIRIWRDSGEIKTNSI